MQRTEINISPSEAKLGLDDQIITTGSCFSQNIGNKLDQYKFQVLSNPYGTVYHPLAMLDQMLTAIRNEPIDSSHCTNLHDLLVHFGYHSALVGETETELIEKIDGRNQEVRETLKKAKWLIFTWGTAYGYYLKKDDKIVANCHKQPSSQFDKILINSDKIVNKYRQGLDELKCFNPNLKVMITVSPVRHVKDSLTLNSVSKAILRTAAHDLLDHAKYFPSYEIMIDDLRDYRYYKDDLLHPTELAQNYIWNKFTQTYTDSATRDFIRQWEKILSSINHRPFNPNTKSHQQFLSKTIEQLSALNSKVDVTREVRQLEEQLTKS